jgi:hypothetical protein
MAQSANASVEARRVTAAVSDPATSICHPRYWTAGAARSETSAPARSASASARSAQAVSAGLLCPSPGQRLNPWSSRWYGASRATSRSAAVIGGSVPNSSAARSFDHSTLATCSRQL